jgi:hypothetical protein
MRFGLNFYILVLLCFTVDQFGNFLQSFPVGIGESPASRQARLVGLSTRQGFQKRRFCPALVPLVCRLGRAFVPLRFRRVPV